MERNDLCSEYRKLKKWKIKSYLINLLFITSYFISWYQKRIYIAFIEACHRDVGIVIFNFSLGFFYNFLFLFYYHHITFIIVWIPFIFSSFLSLFHFERSAAFFTTSSALSTRSCSMRPFIFICFALSCYGVVEFVSWCGYGTHYPVNGVLFYPGIFAPGCFRSNRTNWRHWCIGIRDAEPIFLRQRYSTPRA